MDVFVPAEVAVNDTSVKNIVVESRADVFCGKSFEVSKRRWTDGDRPFDEFNLFDGFCCSATVCFKVFAMLSRVGRKPNSCKARDKGALVHECFLEIARGENLITGVIDWKAEGGCAEDADANVSDKPETDVDGAMDLLLARRAEQSNHTRQALALLKRQPLA